MVEEAKIEIPVQTTGIEEAYTSIGQFAQETTNQADALAVKMKELMEEGFQELIALQAQATLKGSEDWKELQGAIKDAKNELRGFSEEAKRAGTEARAETSKIMDWITKTPSNILSKIPGSAIVGGGLIALLLYGAAETGRIQSEAHSLAQIFESASSQAVGSMEGAVKMFRELASESGISKEKLVGVTEIFARIGIPAQQLVNNFRDVTSNIAGASTALDAFLERPFGTTARDFVTMMTRYNLEGKELISTYVGMAEAARNSGIGTERFMTSVFDASRALKTYGVDIGNVTGLLATMIQHGEKIGIPLEATMTGFTGLAQGLAGLSDAWKATLGMDIMKMRGMTGATPMGGIMMLETGFARAGQPGQETLMTDLLRAMSHRMEQVGRGQGEQVQLQKQWMFMRKTWGLSPEGAGTFRELLNSGALEDTSLYTKATKEQVELLRQQMFEERLKLTPFEQASLLIMEGLSQIARGMFHILTTMLGTIMGAAGYLAGWVIGDDQLRKESIAAIMAIGTHMKEGLSEVWSGLGQLGKAGPALGGMMGLAGQMGTTFSDAVKRAMTEVAEDVEGTLRRTTGAEQYDLRARDKQMMQDFMGIQWRAYEEGKIVPRAVPPAEKIKQIQGEAGVDQIQGSIETKGDTVSLNFNAGELFAALISNPDVAERLSS